MPHLLKNQDLEIHIDLPDENYRLSRFDWTGKIVGVKYKGRSLAGVEIADAPPDQFCGKGFYNEFGIDTPIGYDAIENGDWFHKIGVGLLRKEEGEYDFHKQYEIRPAAFEVIPSTDRIRIICRSQQVNGYAYLLEKNISLAERGFKIGYRLENRGDQPIVTNEYNHNFLSLHGRLIGPDYLLKFPFPIKPKRFSAHVDLEQLVEIGQQEITFNGTPKQQFFFSNLSGGEPVTAAWALENTDCKLGISETGDFPTHSINLWGWRHVISPELFFHIDLQPGRSVTWSRTYQIYEMN